MRISTWTVLKAVWINTEENLPSSLCSLKHINSRDNLPRSSMSPCVSPASTLIPIRILSASKANYCATSTVYLLKVLISGMVFAVTWERDVNLTASRSERRNKSVCLCDRQGEEWAVNSKAWMLELCLTLSRFLTAQTLTFLNNQVYMWTTHSGFVGA